MKRGAAVAISSGVIAVVLAIAFGRGLLASPAGPEGRFRGERVAFVLTFSPREVEVESEFGTLTFAWEMREIGSLQQEIEKQRLSRISELEKETVHFENHKRDLEEWKAKGEPDQKGLEKAVKSMALDVEELREIRGLDWQGYALRHAPQQSGEVVRVYPAEGSGWLYFHDGSRLVSVFTGEIYHAESW